MAKINRFYLLISMLVSYRIGTAMASPELNVTLAGWLQYVAVPETGTDCYICVPVTGYTPTAWETQANRWVGTNSNVKTELNETTSCGMPYYISVGTRAKTSMYVDNSVFALCTTNGWREVWKEQTIHIDTCGDIAYRDECLNIQRSTASDHKAQQYFSTISEDYGDDIETMKWQVCMFGQSDDFCYDEEPLPSCTAGQYYEPGDESCYECPVPDDFWDAMEIDYNEWVANGDARALSPNKNTGDLFSCYIPGSVTYIDNTGAFYFTDNCYYGG